MPRKATKGLSLLDSLNEFWHKLSTLLQVKLQYSNVVNWKLPTAKQLPTYPRIAVHSSSASVAGK